MLNENVLDVTIHHSQIIVLNANFKICLILKCNRGLWIEIHGFGIKGVSLTYKAQMSISRFRRKKKTTSFKA